MVWPAGAPKEAAPAESASRRKKQRRLSQLPVVLSCAGRQGVGAAEHPSHPWTEGLREDWPMVATPGATAKSAYSRR